MNRKVILFFVGFVLAGLLDQRPLFAQEQHTPESEYLRIRSEAHAGDYAAASADARKLVNSFPKYGDARILLGRILAWQKDYDNALAVIDTLLAADPGNSDALDAKKDILLWSKGEEDENTSATDIRADYSFDFFNEPYSRFWQLFRAGAGHKFNWGTASASLNTGHVIIGDPAPDKATEIQIETDAYPVFSKKNYAYMAYAFSPGKYFPQHRAALELWQVLPAGWSVSAGLNFYYFDRSIFIACTSVEKYIGKYWLSLKGFLYFKDNGPTTSGYLNARRYFNDTDYLQLTLSTGTAPDEPFDIKADLMRLSANGIRVSYNRKLSSAIILKIGAGYSIEEYAESAWRNRFEGNAGIVYSIKTK